MEKPEYVRLKFVNTTKENDCDIIGFFDILQDFILYNILMSEYFFQEKLHNSDKGMFVYISKKEFSFNLS